MNPFPKVSTPLKEGVLQISKFLKHQVLLDSSEMEDLFLHLGSFSIYCTSHVVDSTNAEIAADQFLEMYRKYCAALQRGTLPDGKEVRRYFSSIFTADPSAVYAQFVGKNRYLIKPICPVIQLQNHEFYFSELDKKIHPASLSGSSVLWGMQFSYPQIAQDAATGAFLRATDSSLFPNAGLFAKLVSFLRKNTTPTPFIHEGAKMVSPIRLGKKCFSWIHAHPQLDQDLKVLSYGI